MKYEYKGTQVKTVLGQTVRKPGDVVELPDDAKLVDPDFVPAGKAPEKKEKSKSKKGDKE